MRTSYLALLQLVFCVIFLSCLSTSAHCQHLVWEYELNGEDHHYPQDYWVDDNGNSYINIYQIPEDGKKKEIFLLLLNKHGNYRGSLYINSCKNRRMLVPFGSNRYVTSGYNCMATDDDKVRLSLDSRLFNQHGQLLKSGEAFPGNYFARVFKGRQGTFFSKPNAKWGYSFLSIGRLTKDLEVTYDSIPLTAIERADLGIVNNKIKPVQTTNGSWIVPFQYGKVDEKDSQQISLKHGFVLGIADEKILWQYPDTLHHVTVRGVSTYGDVIGVAMARRRYFPSVVALLRQDGSLIKDLKLNPACETINDIEMTADHIILLLDDDRVRWYSYDGEMEHEYVFNKGKKFRLREMLLLPDESLLITSVLDGQALISKLSIDEINERESDELSSDIHFASIEEAAEEALSVAVYPNPTAILVNFELNIELEDSYQIQVFNAIGQGVFSSSFREKNYTLEVAHLPAGTYFYRIAMEQDGKKEIVTGKFVKVD